MDLPAPLHDDATKRDRAISVAFHVLETVGSMAALYVFWLLLSG
jgi:hypothetical protein